MVTYSKMELKDGKLVEKETRQVNELTSDCWLVQFRGIDACVECEQYKTPNCGGGSTLADIIFRDKVNPHALRFMAEYWFEIDEKGHVSKVHDNRTWWTFIHHAPEIWSPPENNMKHFWSHQLKQALKKYQNYVEDQTMSLKRPKGYPKLDSDYPFMKEYYDKDNTIVKKSGLHDQNYYGEACCNPTNGKKSAYRDVVIDTKNNIRLYYFHQHCIAAKNLTTGNTVVDSCGYRTRITMTRLSGFLKNSHIYNEKRKWFVYPKHDWNKDHRIPFVDGMTIKDVV